MLCAGETLNFWIFFIGASAIKSQEFIGMGCLENIITTCMAYLHKPDKAQGEDGTILLNV